MRLKGQRHRGHTERETVHPMDLLPGDRILVPAGAKAMPCEAVVLRGPRPCAWTTSRGRPGEALRPGDAVPAGATVLDGMLTLSVRKPASEGNLAALPALLARARESQGKTLPLLDRIARKFFAFQLLIALGDRALLVGRGPGASPRSRACHPHHCLPLRRLPGHARGAHHRGPRPAQARASPRPRRCLERLAQVSLVVLDKTGTLTAPEGQLHCLERGPAADDPWGLAKGLEQDVDHPLARAFDQADASALAFDERRLSGRQWRRRHARRPHLSPRPAELLRPDRHGDYPGCVPTAPSPRAGAWSPASPGRKPFAAKCRRP
jgi:hypothetical protein